MLKELALLGTVSFLAILLVNVPAFRLWFDRYGGYRFLMLELAHVMVFLSAIVNTGFVMFINQFVGRIERYWEKLGADGPEAVLADLNAALHSGARPSSRRVRRLLRSARFEVLQYQFKRAHNLTHIKKFSFLGYLSKAR